MKLTEPTSSSFSIWSKIWPVLLVAVLLFLALLVDALFSSFGGRFFTHSQIQTSPWMLYYVGHIGMLVVALVLIYIMSGGHPQKFGLRPPLAKSYVSAALG